MPIGHAARTGETAFRRLEDLHTEGCLPARAVIVDTSKARFQREFIRALRSTGTDVTLDPKVAELGEVGKFRGQPRKRIDSMSRRFETLSERTRPSSPPLKRRQGLGAPIHRSSA